MRLEYTYSKLPDRFYERRGPTPFPHPRLLVWNEDLAKDLGLRREDHSDDDWARVLSGQTLLPHGEPLAQAYSGHQFGHFNPSLGDGRALLLGEIRMAHGPHAGRLKDIHLKGSGPTRYSRQGDGKATLSACLREALMGEGLYGLGIPSSRILAVILTGETIAREDGTELGAVCVRIAESHIRIGTFQHFAARNDLEGLETLSRYALDRHAPGISYGPEGVLTFFQNIVESQARLVAQWMSVGFIHGVLNTDNTFISGETLDFGPCAFLETYDPLAVLSRIDRTGRYAYSRQPDVLHWNLGWLGHALSALPDMSGHTEALSRASQVFPEVFKRHYVSLFRKKLGLAPDTSKLEDQIFRFLGDLHTRAQDFTVAFREISGCETHNPAVIPRNHLVEKALRHAREDLDLSFFWRLLTAIRRPFESSPDTRDLESPAAPHERITSTHCNT